MLSITLYLLLAALAGFAIGFRSSRQYHRRAYARQIERHLKTAYRRGANDTARAIIADAEAAESEAAAA
jgi:hypothetical protein